MICCNISTIVFQTTSGSSYGRSSNPVQLWWSERKRRTSPTQCNKG